MAVPVGKILRNIEKSQPQKKAELQQDQNQLVEDRLSTIKEDIQQTTLQNIDVDAKIEEHDPVQYIDSPESDEARKFLNLNNKKRDLYLKAQRLKKEQEHINNIKDFIGKGGKARDYIKDVISREVAVGKTHTNIESRTSVLENKFNSMINDIRVELRTTFGGLKQNKELGYELIRYLKDGRIKNKALEGKVSKMAQQWTETSSAIKNLRNRAGGRIGSLEDWVMPQSHDNVKIVRSGANEWKTFIKPKLDIERIEKEQGANIDNILDSAFSNITGRSIEPPPKGAKKQTAKKHEFERVLHFKDGDSIVEYNKNYGNDDVLSIFDNHIRMHSNEIAQMQVLGGDPEKTYERLKVFARNEGMGSQSEKSLDRIFNVASGKVDSYDIIDNLDATLTSISQGHRAMQIGSKLGGATLSSVADISNIIISSGYRDLNTFKILGKGLKTVLDEIFTVGVGEKTQLAARIGVVSEFANASITSSRFAESGAGWAQRRAENVLRLSGLNAWTNSLRVGFGLEMASAFAENFGKSFDDVPFKKMMEEYGFTADDWTNIQKAELEEVRGAKFLDVNKLIDSNEDLGFKVGEMINAEMDAMIVTPSYRTRAITTWGQAKGTTRGELSRNMSLFKSFPITIMMVHLNRWGHMTTKGRMAYGAGVLTTGVVFGSLSLWLKDIAKGETPRDPSRPQMIPEAIMQSGGLGIFGDLFLNENNTRYGHSWTSTVTGVPSTTIEDIGKTMGDIVSFNEDTVSNAYNRAKNYIPGQNLWYTRLIFQETVGEFIGSAIDPKRDQRKRKRKKALRLRGQKLIFD